MVHTCAHVTAPTGDEWNEDGTEVKGESCWTAGAFDEERDQHCGAEVVVETTEVDDGRDDSDCVGFSVANEAWISSRIKAWRMSSPPESPVRLAARPQPPMP